MPVIASNCARISALVFSIRFWSGPWNSCSRKASFGTRTSGMRDPVPTMTERIGFKVLGIAPFGSQVLEMESRRGILCVGHSADVMFIAGSGKESHAENSGFAAKAFTQNQRSSIWINPPLTVPSSRGKRNTIVQPGRHLSHVRLRKRRQPPGQAAPRPGGRNVSDRRDCRGFHRRQH